MSVRYLTALGTAVGAIAAAAPAMAQPQLPYEYPAPPPAEDMVYRQDPVVQPLPVPPQAPATPPDAYDEHAYADDHARDYEYRRGEVLDDTPLQPPTGYYSTPPAHIDRGEWLVDCRARYRAEDGRRDGGVAGGLLGAAAGGLIGNRVADGERLAGTLIGAGVGGLAGLAIGSAIGAAADADRAEDYCEAWLERYPQGYAHAPAHPYPGPYGYPYPAGAYGPAYYGQGCGCGPAMTYMPVLVAVPQRAVVREYVTEEWVEVEPEYSPPAKRRAVHQPAPRPGKRIKYTKGK